MIYLSLFDHKYTINNIRQKENLQMFLPSLLKYIWTRVFFLNIVKKTHVFANIFRSLPFLL